MANPFAGQAKSTNKSKFKSITGKDGGGQAFDGDKQGAPKVAKKVKGGGDTGSGPIYGGKSKGRLDKFARGGAAKGTGNVNIAIVLPSKGEDKPPEVMMPPPEMMGPPPEGPPPEGPPPGMGMPPMPMGPLPPGGLAEGPPGPPLMRASGGRLPKAGAETGVGRLQKAKLYKKK